MPPSVLGSLADLEQEIARRQAELTEFFNSLCREAGLQVCELETVRGRPADCIVRHAHEVDLVSLGRSGLSTSPEERALGGTTEAVLHHANKPILVGSRGKLTGPVVVAYDGRHPANSALAVACLFAERCGLKLAVLCVKDEQEEARPLLKEARSYLDAHGVEARFLWKQGTVSQAIVAQTGEAGGGMVAMGAFGESRLKEVFLGSHTRRVLVACDCPVLLTR